MIDTRKIKGVIGILTGGGDVPGLNPAIRAITIRANREGYKVIGIRRGWAGLIDIIRDEQFDNSNNYTLLTDELVNRLGRTGGTFLHSSRTRPDLVRKADVPEYLQSKYYEEINDLTSEVINNLSWLNIDYLIPIGGDDTLGYAVHLYTKGIKIVAIPKTMDNDVPGTDYCIGFSTCVTRTIAMTNTLRTSAGSHERILIIEVFGRYAGYTSLLPTMAGAANRCLIPEHKFSVERLAELLVEDRAKNPSRYSIALVSEGAMMDNDDNMVLDEDRDLFAQSKFASIGELVAHKVKDFSAKFNHGKKIETIYQNLGYLVRGGDPDAVDSIVPMAFGNLALDLIIKGNHGKLVILKNGRYDSMPVDIVVTSKKYVEVDKFYNIPRLRPHYGRFEGKPLFIMNSGL